MPKNALAPQPDNFLLDLYKKNVSLPARTYGESLLKSFTGNTSSPITNANVNAEEQASLDALIKQHYAQKMAQFTRPKAELLQNAVDLEKAAKEEMDYIKSINPKHTSTIDGVLDKAKHWVKQAAQLREAAQGKLPTNFAFSYPGYGEHISENRYTNDPQGWSTTLGRFRYEVNPKTGEYRAYDAYDFNNEAHKPNVDNYNQMSAPARMANALADTFIKGNKYALGEAYLSGENSVPVNIKGKLK
jgi:hypothetical protein